MAPRGAARCRAERRGRGLATFMLNVAGVTPEELEVLRHHPAWPGRLAAVHTIPRADTFRPLAAEPSLTGRYRLIT